MGSYEQAEALAREEGFTHLTRLDCATIELLPEVRKMCEANTCGQYGKSWACPPGCGTLEECRERIAHYSWGILLQTVGELEDSLDFEEIMETEERHKENFTKAAELMREHFSDVFSLGAGCCTICAECAYPDKPCRFPEKRVSSVESYGIYVSKLCKDNGIPYNYGPNTIAYTSCFLF